MKKILLFGTMLGMAGTALAFGGIFNHGSKSTTYKGGVNAIGVHFGGEKKTADTKPAEKTCQDGTPCGEGCCYGDNTCQQTLSGEYQCCNDNISLCCDVNQTATWDSDTNSAHCCSGTPYCSSTNVDGDCVRDYYSCCDGTPFIWAKFSYGDQYRCCSGTVYKEVGTDGSDVCCQGETKRTCAYYDENENCSYYTCCNSNETAYCSYIATFDAMKCYSGGCCDLEVNELIRRQPNSDNPNLLCCEKGGERYVLDNGYVKCCPAGSKLMNNNECCELSRLFENQCCPYGTTGLDIDGQCCGNEGTKFVIDNHGDQHCCSADSTGWGGDDGCCGPGQKVAEGHCCEANQQIVEGQCCQAGSTYINEWGHCCAENFVQYKAHEEDEEVLCCPHEPTVLDNVSVCCDDGETGYISYREGDYIETNCCDGNIYLSNGALGEDWYEQTCCPADSTGWGGEDGCCEPGTQPTKDPDGETHCCPNGWDEDNWECA